MAIELCWAIGRGTDSPASYFFTVNKPDFIVMSSRAILATVVYWRLLCVLPVLCMIFTPLPTIPLSPRDAL